MIRFKVIRFAYNIWEVLPVQVQTVRPVHTTGCDFDTREQAEKWAKMLNTK